MNIEYRIIGLRIREIRRMQIMSQAALSEAVDTSTLYISHIETGKKHPSLEMLVRIADALNVTVDTLLCGNQKHDSHQYSWDLNKLMTECNDYEQRVILDTVRELVSILRKNRDLLDNHLSD